MLVVSPAKGLKDRAGTGCGRKEQARRAQLRVGRQRLGDAHERRAIPRRGRSEGAARAVPRHARSITETIAGRTDWFFAPLVSALPLIKDGKLQALAVGTSARSPALPNVPSIAEAGLPTAAYTFWVGLFASAKTPRPSSSACTAKR